MDAFLAHAKGEIPVRFRSHLDMGIKQDLLDVKGEIISLIGSVGSGKTTMAAAVAYQSMKQYYDKCEENKKQSNQVFFRFETMDSIMFDIRKGYSNGSDLRKEYTKCDLLVIDDLFSTNITDNTHLEILNIIDYRYSWCKATIITTNKTMEEIAKIDDRIASRMSDGIIFNLQGKDRRIK